MSALSRPLISKHLVDAAHKFGAKYIAHGCTGKGLSLIHIFEPIREPFPTSGSSCSSFRSPNLRLYELPVNAFSNWDSHIGWILPGMRNRRRVARSRAARSVAACEANPASCGKDRSVWQP